MTRRLSVPVLLVAGVAALGMLASGSSWLEALLPGGLPLGNLVAAAGLLCFAAVPRALQPSLPRLRRAAAAALALAVAWLPVSIALAGNLSLDFGGWRGTAWLWFTLAVHAAVFVVSGWAVLDLVIDRVRARVRVRSD